LTEGTALATDKLEQIFELQAKLDRRVAEGRGLDYDLRTWIEKESVALMVELAEVLEEAHYKWWKNPEEIQMDSLKDELVDVLHFLISMCLKTGMDAEELRRRYVAKNEENIRRQAGLSDRKGYQP
jgi:dimeric dUTPase (all-alpha-NTP-PPase superfamily)